jgi:hypothetical protein
LYGARPAASQSPDDIRNRANSVFYLLADYLHAINAAMLNFTEIGTLHLREEMDAEKSALYKTVRAR